MAPLFRDLLRQNEFWAFLFALGWVLLNWPLITVTANSAVMGIPAILVYVALIWILIILALYLFDRGYSG
jgi:TRAP-type C4-dicarboxylate transport system permease small subunit